MKEIHIPASAFQNGLTISDPYYMAVLLHSVMAYLEDETMDEAQALPLRKVIYEWLREEDPGEVAKVVDFSRTCFSINGDFILSSIYYVGLRDENGFPVPPAFTREQLITLVNATLGEADYLGAEDEAIFAAFSELMAIARHDWDDIEEVVNAVHEEVLDTCLDYLARKYPSLMVKAAKCLKDQNWQGFAGVFGEAYFGT